MSAATDTTEDLDTQVLEELDFPIVCRVSLMPYVEVFGRKMPIGKPAPCGEPAVAVATCKGCSVGSTVCASHQSQLLASQHVTCSSCGKTDTGAELFAFLPLGGVK